ncbi:MAG: hypothetical protein ACP5O0_11155 [Acidimicrobiales bacterium]
MSLFTDGRIVEADQEDYGLLLSANLSEETDNAQRHGQGNADDNEESDHFVTSQSEFLDDRSASMHGDVSTIRGTN